MYKATKRQSPWTEPQDGLVEDFLQMCFEETDTRTKLKSAEPAFYCRTSFGTNDTRVLPWIPMYQRFHPNSDLEKQVSSIRL